MSEVDIAAEVIKVPAHEWLLHTYLPFAQYAIRNRALVSDEGIKPVQRRILWQMFRDGVGPESKHMKAARVAGNTMAFHPHASTSIEDAMARMAQNFSLRVPLIDPYGSVGFVTGDAPAAARYWEARLTKEAMELLNEIKEGGIEMGKNFDGELDEPHQLPIRWPVAIVNGTEGIAVGYASKMYSHNPSEVMEAARAVLKDPNLSLEKLMKIMPGPDLPTGGELMGIDGVRDYYTTGSGSFIVRGKHTIEPMTRGKVKIIFYELPFQVSAESVMQKINVAQSAGKFKEIASVKDLTDKKNGMKLVIETKAGTNHLAVLQQLYKDTPLEERFSVNATVLVDGHPIQSPMIEMLRTFITLRREVTTRKANNRIAKIDHRLHQLAGILAILIDIDKAIKIIRNSDTVDAARKELGRVFKIDAEQSDYILAMQLRRLTKQDALAVQKEQKDLTDERNALNAILTDPAKLDAVIDEDLLKTKKVIASPRRTTITGVTLDQMKEEQKVVAQQARDVDKNTIVYITRFADGRIIMNDEPFAYGNEKKLKYTPIVDQIKVKTQEKIAFVGSDGIARVAPVAYITKDTITTPVKAGVTFPKGVELVGLIKMSALKTDLGLAIGTRKGIVKVVKPQFPNKDEFPVILLEDGDSIVNTAWLGTTVAGTLFYFVSKSSNILTFDAATVRASGAVAGGVKGFNVKDGDIAVAFGWVRNTKDAIVLSSTSRSVKATALSEISPKGRGSQGVLLQKLDKTETGIVNAFVAQPDTLVTTLADIGQVVSAPPVTPRARGGAPLPGGVDFGTRSL